MITLSIMLFGFLSRTYYVLFRGKGQKMNVKVWFYWALVCTIICFGNIGCAARGGGAW